MEMNEVSQTSEDNSKPLTVEEFNFEFLPIIYGIIRRIEKDHHDTAAKTKESQECAQKVLELQKHLDQARAQIHQLRGIGYNKEQQLSNLESLKVQLKLKQELLQKYRYMFPFDSMTSK
ncbi:mediator of RNA polymerase II transcription subunit 9 [Coccinella septempunctata]|uniref:mediator of RNA polymerase II transcription subunit 9 n=1 Tax=Coccinella septempunctata TaxID=41139 RepID=UPI001D097D41|nr:mediator of RNA polymerase II transcription subunit 9 [Coccinella septempunctata]